MASQRVGGIVELKLDGTVLRAKGAFTYGLGTTKRETVIGTDAVHGYKEMPQEAFIEGAITDAGDVDLKKLASGKDLTIWLKLGNGKAVVLHEAWYSGDGTAGSEEGEIAVRWTGTSADEVS